MFTTIQKEENALRLFVGFLKKYYKARAQTFSRGQHWPTLLRFHVNGRNIVALRFAGHRTIEMLGSVTGFKLYATSAIIVAVPCKRTQHCCAALRRSQNNRNVGTCWVESLIGFKLYATSANIVVVPCKRTQQVTTL